MSGWTLKASQISKERGRERLGTDGKLIERGRQSLEAMKEWAHVTVSPKPYGRDWKTGDSGKSYSLSSKAVRPEDQEEPVSQSLKAEFPLVQGGSSQTSHIMESHLLYLKSIE